MEGWTGEVKLPSETTASAQNEIVAKWLDTKPASTGMGGAPSSPSPVSPYQHAAVEHERDEALTALAALQAKYAVDVTHSPQRLLPLSKPRPKDCIAPQRQSESRKLGRKPSRRRPRSDGSSSGKPQQQRGGRRPPPMSTSTAHLRAALVAAGVFHHAGEGQAESVTEHEPIIGNPGSPAPVVRSGGSTHEYEAAFGVGPLGLALEPPGPEYHEGSGGPTPGAGARVQYCAPGSAAESLGTIRAGDSLVCVNGTDVWDKDFDDVMSIIGKAERPLVLVLIRGAERLGAGTRNEEWDFPRKLPRGRERGVEFGAVGGGAAAEGLGNDNDAPGPISSSLSLALSFRIPSSGSILCRPAARSGSSLTVGRSNKSKSANADDERARLEKAAMKHGLSFHSASPKPSSDAELRANIADAAPPHINLPPPEATRTELETAALASGIGFVPLPGTTPTSAAVLVHALERKEGRRLEGESVTRAALEARAMAHGIPFVPSKHRLVDVARAVAWRRVHDKKAALEDENKELHGRRQVLEARVASSTGHAWLRAICSPQHPKREDRPEVSEEETAPSINVPALRFPLAQEQPLAVEGPGGEDRTEMRLEAPLGEEGTPDSGIGGLKHGSGGRRSGGRRSAGDGYVDDHPPLDSVRDHGEVWEGCDPHVVFDIALTTQPLDWSENKAGGGAGGGKVFTEEIEITSREHGHPLDSVRGYGEEGGGFEPHEAFDLSKSFAGATIS